ncbi:MAG: DUF4157 domain-containing protein [Cyanobacteria bacterium J06628_3]
MSERTHEKSNWLSTTPQQDSALKLRRFTTKDDKDEEIQQSPNINLSKFSLSTNSPFPDSNIQRQELEEEKEEKQDNEIVQTKLTVGEPGDKYEQEADTVAAKVVEQINSPQTNQPVQGKVEPVVKPTVMRQGGAAGGAVNQDVEQNIQQARGSGQGLAENVRQPMEQAFGADFSGVKVHTDGQADVLNRSLNSRAFATGQDIFFKQGEYQPGSKQGQELLAHELTHVVQQGGVSSQVQQKLSTSARLNSQNSIKGLAKSVQVFQKSSDSLISKQDIMENIPGGAKNLENVSGSTDAVIRLLEQVAVQAGGRLGQNADFRANVAPQIDAAFSANLSQNNIPIDFIESRGINVRWKGYVRFSMGKPKPVGQPYKASTTANYGGSSTLSNQVTNSTTDAATLSGGLKAADAKIGGEASTSAELSTSNTRTKETTSSTTTNKGGTTTAESMLITYEAPLVAEVYLAPESDLSDTDYINPFKWGMYLAEAAKPLLRKTGNITCGTIRYGISQ